MRSKLAIADSWYKEGGLAALTQAEQEYKDFITFFPNAPEAAEAQMRVGDIYFRQMDRPDRDYSKTIHAEEEYRLMLQQFPDSPLVPQARQPSMRPT
jgi:outer membrane protein assembly factor BamD